MQASQNVDISGLDKAELLCRLWRGTKTVGSGFFAQRNDLPPSVDEARSWINRTEGYVDYFCGKPIKCDLASEVTQLPKYGYDMYAGEGAMQGVVDKMRQGAQPTNVLSDVTDECHKSTAYILHHVSTAEEAVQLVRRLQARGDTEVTCVSSAEEAVEYIQKLSQLHGDTEVKSGGDDTTKK